MICRYSHPSLPDPKFTSNLCTFYEFKNQGAVLALNFKKQEGSHDFDPLWKSNCGCSAKNATLFFLVMLFAMHSYMYTGFRVYFIICLSSTLC